MRMLSLSANSEELLAFERRLKNKELAGPHSAAWLGRSGIPDVSYHAGAAWGVAQQKRNYANETTRGLRKASWVWRALDTLC